ncbi:MAG: SCO family protein [Verrucomicrobiia bacterium]|jgi:cytochrome oxidase Cu insertion factor (SCO1/SenC/PrrC family)
MKVKTILNIGVASTFAIVVGSILLIVIRGAPTTALAMEVPVMGWVPEFSLTEANGTTVRRGDLLGKVWIASFLFTRCAEACPLLMHHEVQLLPNLPARDDLRLVSFSVDPDWDTPKVLTEYARTFGADRSRWSFLTGDKKQIYHLSIDGFRLAAQEGDPAKEMPILHSTKLVLVDRHGAIRGYYDSTDEIEMQKLVRDARRVLAERS